MNYNFLGEGVDYSSKQDSSSNFKIQYNTINKKKLLSKYISHL